MPAATAPRRPAYPPVSEGDFPQVALKERLDYSPP